jgi:hypothetical protein
MGDDTQELKERISKLSDEELIEMVTVAADEYRQEALDYAKAELKYRRVDWSQPNPEEAEPADESGRAAEEPLVNRTAATCVCGGALRSGTLVAEKELTIIFLDNREERFIRVAACVRCGQLSLVADYDTVVEEKPDS